jgi:peptide deformylase
VTDLEGCLSLPGLVGSVERHEAVTIKAKNRFGKPLKIEAGGWLARIFQHEIDHLDGVLYIDRAEEVFELTPGDAEQIKD